MASNNVSITVREISEEMISAITNQAANISDEISPLAVTPRGIQNRTPPPKRTLQHHLPTRKSLFGANTIDESQINNGVILVDTPDNICPSDDARTNIDPNPNLPVPETLKDQLFSEGYDSDGLRVEYEDASK